MNRLDRALRRRSFRYFAWRRYRDLLAGVRRDLDPLMIFQMGKVGSSTVYQALAGKCPGYEVFQIHALSRAWIRTMEAQFREASRIHGRNSLDEHVLASRYLHNRMRGGPPPGGKWTVVSIVREPVGRNVSAFFQAFPVYFASEAAQARDPTLSSLSVERLQALFLDGFGEYRHRVPLVWFETHLAPAFGIDVYAEPFDPAAGYRIYENRTCRLLLLRTEDLSRTLRTALHEFLGIRTCAVGSENVSAEKHYADAFGDFSHHLELPAGYLDTMYASRYARHFYTADELEGFRTRWSS